MDCKVLLQKKIIVLMGKGKYNILMNVKIVKKKNVKPIKRVRLSEDKYEILKDKAERFDSILSTIKIDIKKDIENAKGWGYTKALTTTVNVDVEQILKICGIVWHNKAVKVKQSTLNESEQEKQEWE